VAELAAAGFQTALMAPTEILARQHFESMAEPLEKAGIQTVLLTGRDKGAQRQEKLAALADGTAGLVVGTHALFQDEVRFHRLGLAVIDEQHRFGVAERRRLMAKGQAVHLIALSATPIPRTLELTLFGDLDVSRIDEKPPGRQPVLTTATPLVRVDSVIRRLAEVTEQGAQAFWICPLVAESEVLDVQAAEVRAVDLAQRLSVRVGLIHGKMPPAEKDRVMSDFAKGDVAVLVATTVVEVGVNVPNATIMVIEHAERFGLAQLHQLRGRVGRSTAKSACLLLYAAPLSANAKARIEILRQTEDGFEIAERDLSLRGGGDLMGLKQSGLPNYRFADPIAHADLVRAASDDARLVLSRDPDLLSERGQTLRVLCELFDWRADDAFAEAS
jgi:ATP-dependent DNA helicase RecG